MSKEDGPRRNWLVNGDSKVDLQRFNIAAVPTETTPANWAVVQVGRWGGSPSAKDSRSEAEFMGGMARSSA
jgi:hypothetical protein